MFIYDIGSVGKYTKQRAKLSLLRKLALGRWSHPEE